MWHRRSRRGARIGARAAHWAPRRRRRRRERRGGGAGRRGGPRGWPLLGERPGRLGYLVRVRVRVRDRDRVRNRVRNRVRDGARVRVRVGVRVGSGTIGSRQTLLSVTHPAIRPYRRDCARSAAACSADRLPSPGRAPPSRYASRSSLACESSGGRAAGARPSAGSSELRSSTWGDTAEILGRYAGDMARVAPASDPLYLPYISAISPL